MNTIEIQTPTLKQKLSSANIMKNLKRYIELHNMDGIDIVSHKFRIIYRDFYFGKKNTGTLYIQAHLKHLFGIPKYWQFEFKLEGSKSHLTLEDFTIYKLTKKCRFQSKEDNFQTLTTEERVDYLIRRMERLRTAYIESSDNKLKRWFDSKHPERIYDNPYITEYKRNTRAVSPESRKYITLPE
jgi:hypothetical protein